MQPGAADRPAAAAVVRIRGQVYFAAVIRIVVTIIIITLTSIEHTDAGLAHAAGVIEFADMPAGAAVFGIGGQVDFAAVGTE